VSESAGCSYCRKQFAPQEVVCVENRLLLVATDSHQVSVGRAVLGEELGERELN
jgi:hypothetical protein